MVQLNLAASLLDQQKFAEALHVLDAIEIRSASDPASYVNYLRIRGEAATGAGSFALAEESALVAQFALMLIIAALAAPGSAQTREDQSSARERAAIHECSIRGGKYSNTKEQTMQSYAYHAWLTWLPKPVRRVG
jgi:hypothetical protein